MKPFERTICSLFAAVIALLVYQVVEVIIVWITPRPEAQMVCWFCAVSSAFFMYFTVAEAHE